jgi:DNA-binding transcriptional regulator YiaG
VTPAAIRSLRKRHGLSKDDFAEELGFTGKNRRITVWRWESRNRRPSRQAIIMMGELARRFQSLQRSSRD